MLTGREHFYEQWQEFIRDTTRNGPILDLGTPSPFFKELTWLEGCAARPYVCTDLRVVPEIDFASDARSIPCRAGTFGAVLCQHLVSYVPDPQCIIDEIWRVLRPGGTAYVSMPSVAPYTGGYGGLPGDVVRFAPGAPEVMFREFSKTAVLPVGNLAHALWNYLPRPLRSDFVQRAVNSIDRRLRTRVTSEYYVFATK